MPKLPLGAVGVAAAVILTSPVSYAGFGIPEVAIPLSVGAQSSLSVGAPAPTGSLEDGPKNYAAMGREECESALTERGVPFVHVDEARGVLAPVRLTGPVRGVTYRTALPPAKRQSTPWEIVDCRLALALDDFAAQLSEHDIVEVIHYSVYRPPSSRWPKGKLASRHPGALAIDAATFVKKNGQTLAVERDFHGHIGARTCRPSTSPLPPEAKELRQIVCDAADAGIFNLELTPDYNRAHHNHFHLELTRGAHGTVVH